MRNLVYAGLAVLIASTAFAAAPDALTAGNNGPPAQCDTLGSVIRSFTMSGTSTPYALGIFRDASYVYGVFYSPNHLRRFTSTGSMVSTHSISGASVPRGGDVAHLGSGYMSLVCPTTRRLYVYRVTGGAPVASMTAAGSAWPMNNFYDGTYYYTNGPNNRGMFYRYTTSGSSAGTWTCSFPMSTCGGATYVDKFNGGSGGYIVACSWTSGQASAGFTKAGSLVRSFTLPRNNTNGACGGPSSGAFGEVYWVNRYTGSLVAMEIDLGNTTSVTPISLGKVKSLFR